MLERCLKMYLIKNIFSHLKKAINQEKHDKNKVYSIHEPQTKCIAKGKSNKKYEYGGKVSIVATKSRGIIVGCMGFKKNEYDGNTLSPAIYAN
jgi:IS5 family transposase